MTTIEKKGAVPAAPGLLSEAYRTVWRWHFYAGLLVLPFLMLMALTGGIYLFKGEIDGLAYRDLSHVEARSQTASPDRWIAAAEAGTGGKVTNLLVPARPDQAVRLTVTLPDGAKRTAFVDPHDARLIGTTPFGGVMETVKRLHSLILLGKWANAIVEIVAGWAIILVATGLFMWWPRGRSVGVTTIKATDATRRPFWRDLHAVTGLYAGAIIVFLALTGMPWSAVWGDQVMGYLKDHGLGRPRPPAASPAFEHAEHMNAPVGVGWTMEGMVMPTPDAMGPARLSAVVATADAQGLPRPYTVSIPTDPALAWTAARVVERVEDNRILYIDATTGAVRADVRYDQFGLGAKAYEWGIGVHQGTQYGWINRYLMLAGCIAIWILGLSALVMWWKRRPKGHLAAPVAPPGPRAKVAVLAIVLPLAILYPLTGLSLIVAVVLDRLVLALTRPHAIVS
ncbi:PepSY-associated TM helix domain-containing protein [Brevundimonas subvibrioides]|uniref:PepSY-associated TM helix domain-containing protein n=1 Tax=Brevundimonas subvibrioides TaxID=74313 RepID=UPI0022B3BE5A|nr:PepSY domain-containing protein [Brevundimonas subvibrioides]